MKTDRLTKSLLAAIAMGLWMNALNPWISFNTASADVESDMSRIRQLVLRIEDDLNEIHIGTCSNPKLCRGY